MRSANKWKQPPPWTVDPLSFVEDPRLDPKGLALLLVLSHRANADGDVRGGAWLSRHQTQPEEPDPSNRRTRGAGPESGSPRTSETERLSATSSASLPPYPQT